MDVHRLGFHLDLPDISYFKYRSYISIFFLLRYINSKRSLLNRPPFRPFPSREGWIRIVDVPARLLPRLAIRRSYYVEAIPATPCMRSLRKVGWQELCFARVSTAYPILCAPKLPWSHVVVPAVRKQYSMYFRIRQSE